MRTSHRFTKPGAAATAAAVFAALSLVQAAPAAATGANGGSTGVVNIDQAKAEAGGVTANDTPGFPVTISQAGTYRLTGNLVVGSPNTTVIEVTADNVTLDLNGYSIHVVMRNGNHGIGTHSSLVSNNTVVANGGAGLFLIRSGFGGNSLVGNYGGGPQLSVTESAPVAPNFCNVALCP